MSRDPAEQLLEELSPSITMERATEINWLAYTLDYRNLSGNLSSVCETDHFRILSGEPTPVLNHVAWGGLDSENLEERVQEITQKVMHEVAKPNVTCEWFTVGTHSNYKKLEQTLTSAGWSFSYEVPGMTCKLAPFQNETLLPSEMTIERVRTSEEVAEWLAPYMDGFSLHPHSREYLYEAYVKVGAIEDHPFHHYALRYRGSVISTGSIQFRFGVAVIYNICTLTKARNLGGATAMVKFLKSVAVQEGYQSVSLFALEAGQKIYEKLGFAVTLAVTRTFRIMT